MSITSVEPVDILVVDDHSENLLSMEAVLASPGVRLVFCRSGQEALRSILEYDFALIVLDVQMPEMDGFETAGLIRQRDRSKHTPIIFVTAINKTERNIFQGYSLGAVDYIFKPFMPEVLKSKVEIFVEFHRTNTTIRRQNEQLAQINREFETFSRTLSADLQGASSRLFAMAESAGTTEAAQKDLGRMKWLFASLVDFSRPVSKEEAPALHQLDSICGEAIRRIRQEWGGTAEWAIAELPPVRANRTALEVIFRNLLTNMVRLVEGEKSPRIEVGSYPDGKFDVIYFKENGRAISVGDDGIPATVRHLGEAPGLEGLGIAFAVAQRLIRENLGGRLWTKPGSEKGSTVLFSIPREERRNGSHAGRFLEEAGGAT